MADRDKSGKFLEGHSSAGPGRDSLYHPDMNEQATKLALLGMTDEEMAAFFGVAVQTLYNWQKEHIAFFEAVHAGKDAADAEVAHSLFKKATGITYQVERLRKNAEGQSEVVKLSVYEPPDTAAMKQWLSNRRRQNWSDTVKLEHTGELTFTKIERRIVSPTDN
jgi:DNA-binding XRE family transcriptional regulator